MTNDARIALPKHCLAPAEDLLCPIVLIRHLPHPSLMSPASRLKPLLPDACVGATICRIYIIA